MTYHTTEPVEQSGNQTAINARNAMNAYSAFAMAHEHAKALYDAKQGIANSLVSNPLDLALKIAFAEMMFAHHQPTAKGLSACLAECAVVREIEDRWYRGEYTTDLLAEMQRVTKELGGGA